ncbi:MFS transporter [Aurantimonas sp. Leaf443]|uniref:MFS transporter n=1 Tax=Aurantimonas sp. Leaf443 TaxID=1736378 RepID=UPI0006F87C24|nr:MFS transporter [Aurantimonas sp. Leaf443]KQT82841.1 MFS transporter [Aurantimonas sp. Leaf443]
MREPHYLEPPPNWTAEERPTLPGSPGTPYHRPPVRLAYAAVGVLVGITGGLGNALVTANLPQIQGQLGLTPVEGAWLPAAYVMFNVSANLLLVKARQQFGIRRFAEIGILAYVLVTLVHVLANDYATAVFARAVSGFAAAPMSSLGLYYMMQAFPKRRIGAGLSLGFALSQFAVPIAWLVSPPLLDIGDWRGLYLFELGMALVSMAAVVVLKLPPGLRIKVFEPLDLLTFLLMAPAFALVCAVLGQGRTQWWPDQPWMAQALIAALLLLLAAFFLEHHRANPLIQTRWLGAREAIRFALGALGLRFILSEQTYAATGLLRTLGMGPDQLRPLYAVILAGTVLGAALSAALFSPRRLVPLILTSIVLVIVGSSMDLDASNLTRPHDLFVSQFLVSTAAGMFLGPLLVLGMTPVLARGTDYVITLIVVFSLTQSIGGLAGPAAFATFQQYREHEYSALLVADVDPTDAAVARRIQQQAQPYAALITDPVRLRAQGVAQLSQAVTREANVRAYNDVVWLNLVIALVFLVWSLTQTPPARRLAKSILAATFTAKGVS